MKRLPLIVFVVLTFLCLTSCSTTSYIPTVTTYIPRLIIENPFPVPLEVSFWDSDLNPSHYSKTIDPYSYVIIDFPSGYDNIFSINLYSNMFMGGKSIETVFLSPYLSTATVVTPRADYGYIKIINKTGETIYDVKLGEKSDLVYGHIDSYLNSFLIRGIPSFNLLSEYYVRVSEDTCDYLYIKDSRYYISALGEEEYHQVGTEKISVKRGEIIEVTIY